MLDIRPFRGLRYNLQRVGDLSAIICPPYDVISPKEQETYYSQSSYNVIRLELPSNHTDIAANKYDGAALQLKTWVDEGVLIREEVPAFYVTEHQFTYQGKVKRRRDLIAATRLEQWGSGIIRPHEVVIPHVVQDRLSLMQSCHANFSPIWGMVRHEHDGLLNILSQVTHNEPEFSAEDKHNIVHNVWVVKDDITIRQLVDCCSKSTLYIADGHHRYQTALTYQEQQLAEQPHQGKDSAYNFAMMTITDAGDPGMILKPTHRLIKTSKRANSANLKKRLTALSFEIEDVSSFNPSNIEALLGTIDRRGNKDVGIGVYGLPESKFCIIWPRDRECIEHMFPSEHSQLWKELNVSLLDCVVLREIMNIDTASRGAESVGYTQDAGEAIQRVESGEYDLAFLLSPPSISTILDVADMADRMPPKSTYFYPKHPTGFVMYPFWND